MAPPRLKNYTSVLSVEESLALIRRALSQHRARRITFENDEEGDPIELYFELEVSGKRLTFRLPARFAGVEERVAQALKEAQKAHSQAVVHAQARRTAWANIKDWVLAQMALIDSGNSSVEELFFPFLLADGERTAFEAFEAQLALPAPKAGSYSIREEG